MGAPMLPSPMKPMFWGGEFDDVEDMARRIRVWVRIM